MTYNRILIDDGSISESDIKYAFNGKDQWEKPLSPIFVLNNEIASDDISGEYFVVRNNSDIDRVFSEKIKNAYIDSRLIDVINTALSQSLIQNTIDPEDVANIVRLRQAISAIEQIQPTELEVAQTIRRDGIGDIVNQDTRKAIVDELKERVASVFNRGFRYELKGFSLNERWISLDMLFVYEFNNGNLSAQSRTPLNIGLKIDEFDRELFISSVSAFVRNTIKNLKNSHKQGSEELKLAVESINSTVRTGRNEKTFISTDSDKVKRLGVSIL